jgi:putative endonuclease
MVTRAGKVGNEGEQAVIEWLQKKGFSILARNFTTRWGEVDIIAQRDEVVAFIEVKTRSVEYFPSSLVVIRSKQRRIIAATHAYIIKNKIEDKVFRFDVAIVIKDFSAYRIEYIENAFQED